MFFLCPSDLNPTVLRKEEGVALLMLSQQRSVGGEVQQPLSLSVPSSKAVLRAHLETAVSVKKGSGVFLYLAKQQNTCKLWTDTEKMQGRSIYKKQLSELIFLKRNAASSNTAELPNRTVDKRVKKLRNSRYYEPPCIEVGASPCQKTTRIIQSCPCCAF